MHLQHFNPFLFAVVHNQHKKPVMWIHEYFRPSFSLGGFELITFGLEGRDVGVPSYLLIFFYSWQHWGLNSGLCPCKAGAVPVESHLQSMLVWLFWRWSLWNYLPRLVSNSDLLISAS
jgi:hypothetical protein